MNSNNNSIPFRTQLAKLHIQSMKHKILQFDPYQQQPKTSSESKNEEEEITRRGKGCLRIERQVQRVGVVGNVEFQVFDSQKSIRKESVDRGSKFVHRSGVNLKKLEKSDTFECRGCNGREGRCLICQNEKVMDGNSNFLKFLDFVLAFKLGSQKSYQHPKNSISHSESINSHCIQFFSSCSLSPQNLHTSIQSYDYSTLSRKISQDKSVHSDYQCDSCGVYPIVGTRVHCSHSECNNDTDLCESCYSKYGHEHEEAIQFIRQSNQYKARKNIMSKIESELSSSQSIKKSSLHRGQKQNREIRSMFIEKSIKSAMI